MEEKVRRSRRRVILLSAFVLLFLLYLSTINPELSDLSGDSTRFLLLAKSLSQGRGYREIEKPKEPLHSEYMPGLPVLLAPLYRFVPEDLKPMKFLMVLSCISGVVFFWLFLFREPPLARALVCFSFGLVPFLLLLQTEILSDLPHLAFLLLFFFWFEKSREQAREGIASWVIAGFLTALAFYFRQLAILAFGSAILVLLLEKNLRRLKIILSYSVSFLAPASVWYLRNFLVAGAMEPSYGKKLWYAEPSNPFAGTLTFSELITRILHRMGFFSLELGKDLMLGSFSKALLPLWILLLLFLVLGLGSELLKRKNLAGIYFLPYLVAVSSWEGWKPRYLLPLIPLSLFFIYRGLEISLARVSKNKPWAPRIPLLIFSLWLVFNLVRCLPVIIFQHSALLYPKEELAQEQEALALIGQKNFAFYTSAYDWQRKGEGYFLVKCASYYHFFAMAEWVRRNLKPEEVVVCRKPSLFAWQSQGKSIQFPAELELDKFLEQLKKQGAHYLLIEEISPELRPILLNFWNRKPEQFQLVKLIGQTYLLKIN